MHDFLYFLSPGFYRMTSNIMCFRYLGCASDETCKKSEIDVVRKIAGSTFPKTLKVSILTAKLRKGGEIGNSFFLP